MIDKLLKMLSDQEAMVHSHDALSAVIQSTLAKGPQIENDDLSEEELEEVLAARHIPIDEKRNSKI